MGKYSGAGALLTMRRQKKYKTLIARIEIRVSGGTPQVALGVPQERNCCHEETAVWIRRPYLDFGENSASVALVEFPELRLTSCLSRNS